jgi:hypothetical protein
LADTAKPRNFAIAKAKQTLPCGVMVARRILVPPVRVRILPRQQKKELNHYDLALFFAPAQNVKNCIFSDAWGLMGRIVINLCLGVYFAKPEEEKYAARHYMFLTAGKRSATRE